MLCWFQMYSIVIQFYMYVKYACMCTHVYSFSDSLPFRLLQNIEYASLLYAVGPCSLVESLALS